VKFEKLEKHLESDQRRDELLDIENKLVEHDFPPQLVIENTSYCNMECLHCAHPNMTRKPAHMNRALWNKIVEEVGREMPECEVWPTFYGEALILGDELWDRLDYADQVGCKNLVLNSNGRLLGRFDNIEKIIASPLKRFILSLDGFKPETFEKIRKKGKWDEVYPQVEELCRRLAQTGQKYPAITAQYSIMKDNVDEVEDFKKYWSERGAEVKVRPLMEWTNSGHIKSDTIIHGSDFRIACPWANNTMAIHQNGDAVTCAVDYDNAFNVGNASLESVKTLWKRLGEKVRKPHRDHRWDDIPDICKRCGDWQVAGAQYEEETVEGTRPFWFKNEDNIPTGEV